MKTLFLVGSAIVLSLSLGACSSDGIKTLNAFEKDLKSRGCASNGNVTLGSATITSLPTVNGDYHWDCPKTVVPAPAT